MSLPGLALPGLISDNSSNAAATTSATEQPLPGQTHTETLSARSELRYEVPLDCTLTITLQNGHAEVFGTELAPRIPYRFSGTKGAIYTWHGCTLVLNGASEHYYLASATEAMVEWLNIHGHLEDLREDSSDGPRVLILGPDSSGKTSLLKCLAGWSLKSARTPMVVNLDSRHAMLSIPGSLSAVTCNTMLDVQSDGLGGHAGTTDQRGIHDKAPLVYGFPFASPEDNTDFFRAITTRMALATTYKLQGDAQLRRSGMLIDAPSALNNPKTNYALVQHIVSEFGVDVVLCVGSERLYNDMSRKYTKTSTDGSKRVTVLRVAPSPGAEADEASYAAVLRARVIKSYFFGSENTLHGPTPLRDFSELHIFRAIDPKQAAHEQSFLPGGLDNGQDDNDDYDPSQGSRAKIFEKVEPSAGMVNGVMAIKFAGANEGQETIRDSCVMGYVYVAGVNEDTKKVRVLYPHPGKWTDRAWVWCADWPEAVADLVM